MEGTLIAITNTNKVYSIDLRCSRLECEISKHKKRKSAKIGTTNNDYLMKIPYSVIDCVFASETKLIFLCANLNAHIIYYDLSKQECTFILSNDDLYLKSTEFLCYLSNEADNQIITTSIRGSIRMLNHFDENEVNLKCQ